MSTQAVPRIFHFIYFGGGEFHLIHYLAVSSAKKTHPEYQVTLYIDSEPNGIWWERCREIATIETITAPDQIHGIPIVHPAHKSDIARLEILYEYGGIYLDMDILCNKSFDPLLVYPVVLGKEEIVGITVGICSAVILAQPQSLFIERWIEGFDPKRSLWKGFRSSGNDKYYSEMTTRYAYFLSKIYPEEVHIEPRESFFKPNYTLEELNEFFKENTDSFEGAYCYHLWSNAAWKQYLSNLSMESVINGTSTFAQLAKQFI